MVAGDFMWLFILEGISKLAKSTSILRNEGYTYSTFSTSFDSSVLKGFGIKCFPAVVVLNPDGNMIYFGDIEGAAKLVDFIFK